MATSTAKKRSAAKKTPAPGKLNSFLHDVREEHPDFAFTRYWYQEKKGREGISGWIDRKPRKWKSCCRRQRLPITSTSLSLLGATTRHCRPSRSMP